MPRAPGSSFVTGLVLAAGGSDRLGQPKQLLPFGKATLLDHVLSAARSCEFDQLVVAIGGAADRVRAAVDLGSADVVVNPSYGEGCSSSIASSLEAVDPRCDVLVLMLGDQPGVGPSHVRWLLGGRGDAALAACRYDDGRGHPLAFSREMFPELARLHGDKAVWKLLERQADSVADVRVPGLVPLDVDTWEDYQALLAGTRLDGRPGETVRS
jgi:molybdenum cofactor cytidylyltransferase